MIRRTGLFVFILMISSNALAGVMSCPAVKTPVYPKPTGYADALAKGLSEDQKMGAAQLGFWEVNEFCRDVHNWYENRAKCAEGRKLGLGFTGGMFGVAGTVMATAGTGGAWPGIAAGVAGLTSATLGSAEKGPLGTAAYEAGRMSASKANEDAVKSLATAKSAAEVNTLTLVLLSRCPLPLDS